MVIKDKPCLAIDMSCFNEEFVHKQTTEHLVAGLFHLVIRK